MSSIDPRAFACLVSSDRKILLITRSHNANNGGKIGLPGGHVDGQLPLVALTREIQEEVGLDILPSFFTQETKLQHKGNDIHLMLVQLPYEAHRKELRPDPKEVSMAAFVSIPQLLAIEDLDLHYSVRLLLASGLLNEVK